MKEVIKERNRQLEILFISKSVGGAIVGRMVVDPNSEVFQVPIKLK